ncbi:cyclase family protein [Humisphaera borealis]|uniref:Cyclase family protein n=1 Tax=Humisphaera borealis TaxID=2807512 RepID=A0A7M2X2D4_9BACT|nr:cyclase family protein [Humisphaera borealis]QOV91908.1 cyclase family protein [Humisphaera borealis]
MRSISLTVVAMLMVFTGCATGGKPGGANHGAGGDPSPRPVAIDPAKVIDLSYAFGDQTIYWPTAEPFKLRRVAYGRTPGGYFYAANNISMAEHGGTHMDAPIHFAEGKRTSGEVPLSNCIGPAAVIDVRGACAADADYLLTVDDLLGWERSHGRLPRGAIVVMHSGWGERWPDKKRYLGTDVPLDVDNLRFPGFSPEAATFLVTQRDVAAIAVDTASVDRGQSKDFRVHQIMNGANKPMFENVANVGRLPPAGATFIALPLKIENGSGGPARIIAVGE